MKFILILCTLLLCTLLLFSTPSRAQHPEKPVPAGISKVTVYQNGAQITREARVNLPPGTTTLVFSGLTPYLDPRSLQVDAEGDFTVLAVTHRHNYVDESAPAPEAVPLLARKAAKEDSLSIAQTMLQVYRQEEDMLLGNKAIGGTGGIQVAELKTAIEYFRERLTDIKSRQLAVQKEIDRLQTEIQ